MMKKPLVPTFCTPASSPDGKHPAWAAPGQAAVSSVCFDHQHATSHFNTGLVARLARCLELHAAEVGSLLNGVQLSAHGTSIAPLPVIDSTSGLSYPFHA